jgi:hypothetical protein
MKILRNFSVIAMVAMMASCGGSGSSGKKLASNEFLGDLPNLVYQKGYSDSVLNANEKAEMDKLDGSKKSDWEKAAKIDDKYDIKKEEADKKFEAEVEKIKPSLVGKDIPFEVEEGIGYEITSCKVSKVEGSTVYVDFEVKVTDFKVANIERYGNKLILKWHEIDKEGKLMGSEYGHVYYLELDKKEDGATGKTTQFISISSKEAEKYVNFAKIKFVNSK